MFAAARLLSRNQKKVLWPQGSKAEFICSRNSTLLSKARHFPAPAKGVLPPMYINQREFSSNNPERKDKNRMGLLTSVGLGASMLLGKTKYALAALKITKAAPLASMVLTSFTYSLFFGWPYAVGMVGLIACHEAGHAIVMHRYGVPFSPMVFIPFMGAVIAMKEQPRNSYEEAMIAIGGPVTGSMAALALSTAGGVMDSQLLYALADFGLMINLFNLLPIGSLDGGRIGNAVSPYFGVVGLVAGGGLIYTGMVSNPIFYLIMMSGTYTTGKRLFGWMDEEEKVEYERYHRISSADQSKIVAAYLCLVACLVAAMAHNNKKRLTPKQLQRRASMDDYHGSSEGRGSDWNEGGGDFQGDGVYDDFFGSRSQNDGKWI